MVFKAAHRIYSRNCLNLMDSLFNPLFLSSNVLVQQQRGHGGVHGGSRLHQPHPPSQSHPPSNGHLWCGDLWRQSGRYIRAACLVFTLYVCGTTDRITWRVVTHDASLTWKPLVWHCLTLFDTNTKSMVCRRCLIVMLSLLSATVLWNIMHTAQRQTAAAMTQQMLPALCSH